MNFIDLQTQYKLIESEINSGIKKILDSGTYIMGAEVAQLEKLLAQYSGVKHCLTCSSGTDALLIPLMAWGITSGDAVFSSPFTFIATSEVVRILGATPVFVDIEPDTFNISPGKLREKIFEVKKEGKLNPKAIIPVDLFGLTADYNEIEKIAKEFGLLVLEDAAQSFGADYKGKKSCSFGDAAATSFYPAKPLGCYGDGGAVFTNNDELFDIMQSIRVHGQGHDKYNNVRVGINGRLDTIQAAVLLAKMKLFDNEIVLRNKAANKYNLQLGEYLTVPQIPNSCQSVWAQYSVLADDEQQRANVQKYLADNKIPTAIYYPKPLHLQEAFKDLNYSTGDFLVSENIASRIFSLPMHPYLKDEEIELICSKIIEYFTQ